MYTIIALYKAPNCSFEEFKTYLESVAHLQISNQLIIVGDFNFDVTRNMNKTFVLFMKSLFPKAKMLQIISTTQQKTLLDLCFTTCSQTNADIITCVWSYHHTLVVSVY